MSIQRRVGEGVTVHEKAIEAAIGRVPQWRGRAARYASLVGGLMNQNWVVEIEGDPRRYFVKVPGEGSEIFINRTTANEAARNAHAMGVAPEVVFFDATDGLEISEFLEGYRACTNADFGDPDIQADALSLYRRIHSGPRLKETKTIFDMIDEHIAQGRELARRLPDRHGLARTSLRPGQGGLHGFRPRHRALFQRPDARQFSDRPRPFDAEAHAADRLRIRLQQ